MNKSSQSKIYGLLSGLLLFLVLSSFTLIYPGGSPGKYSGAPGDGKNCTICHGGSASNQTGIITSDVDANGYVAGNTYTITVTISGSGKKGFEVSPQNASGDLLGTLITGSGTKLVNSNIGITQTSSKSSDPAVWTFQWTSPPKGTGEVTFYGAFAKGKSNTLLSTLTVSEKNTSSVEDHNSIDFQMYPNPVKDLLTVEMSLPTKSKINISLLSIEGKNVAKLYSAICDAGNQNLGFDIKKYDVKPGTYFLQVESNKGRTVDKIIIE